MTIEVVPLRSETSRQSSRTAGQRRAEMFRSGDHRQAGGDDVVRAARSQFAAIGRALSKAVRDPELRRSVLAQAKELDRTGKGSDRALAMKVWEFVAKMPDPETRREQLIRELTVKVRALGRIGSDR